MKIPVNEEEGIFVKYIIRLSLMHSFQIMESSLRNERSRGCRHLRERRFILTRMKQDIIGGSIISALYVTASLPLPLPPEISLLNAAFISMV